MFEIFISYARSTAAQAQKIADALRGLGYSVWRDDELPAHRSYTEVTEERLKSAKAVVVIWSTDAVKSDWVQSEADQARADRKLIQLTIDGAKLPMPFDRIQCADLVGWTGDAEAPGWRKLAASVADLTGGPGRLPTQEIAAAKPPSRELSICVLPFANMSGDAEQEYFSDGISEDIITDLSKVSALSVIARNTSFQFRGKSVDAVQVARQLNATHMLEGSVRKAGDRVRITAQLIDGLSGNHIWAERYDRDLNDIFALQDEISQAVVKALKLKLLPDEKKAIEKRGTESPEAYKLYLLARHYYLMGKRRHGDLIMRLCKRAIEVDSSYAQAWGLLAICQADLNFKASATEDSGWEAAERALALNSDIAEAHSAKGRILTAQCRYEEAGVEHELALGFDPESYEVNCSAARWLLLIRDYKRAIHTLEKAASLLDADYWAAGMVIQAYDALGDTAGARRAAQILLDRVEKALVTEPANGSAMAFGAAALVILGMYERAKEWAAQALLVDPDTPQVRMNVACAMVRAGETDMALDLLEQVLSLDVEERLHWTERDSDLDSIREHPRFKAMIAEAKERLAAASPGRPLPS